MLKETVYRSGAGYRPLLESEKVLSGTREEGSPSARRVWYEDGRDNYHCAAKEYLRRISIIWSSPLYDCNRVQATNQYALPVLRYLMWTQHWPLSELRDVDRAARKIIVENGGKHPASLTSLLYLPREKGGRDLRSVEHEYKITKIKSLLKLYQNSDQTVEAVRDLKNTPWHQATSRS